LQLADTMKTVGALEAPKLLPVFEKAPSEKLGLQLVAALAESPGLAGLRPSALRTLFALYPPSVQRSADTLITSINTDAARQNARVDELLTGVKDGDVRRGNAVFNSPKTACTLCHVIGYGGGRLGPDLTSIGRIRQERELLEAILYPSATLVRGYEPVIVTTKNGETHSGIVRKDADDEIVLATGPESEQRIARAEITDVQPGPISPMPPGMEAVLTPRELTDLVVFLKSRQ
jgi:putative heme-binding domain-containing protein